jgi:hypothetical protein
MNNVSKSIKVKMFRIVGDLAPLVRVDYIDKDAQEHSGLMILDSCSTVNVLSSEMANCIGVLGKKDNEIEDVVTSTNIVVSLNRADFSFAFGGVQFHETFCINDHRLPHIKGDLPLVGILGNKFMLKHRLVIDYSDFTIHNSNANSDNLAISDCDLFVPMGYGLVNYGIPLLAMIQGENQIFSMADTGASFNIIARQTITDYGFECQYLGESDSISGLGASETKAEDAMVKYKIETMKEDDGSLDEISFCSQFKVIPHYPYTLPHGRCDKEGLPLPPVEAIISSPFMAKEGWVLDFGADIVYKRKTKSSALLKAAI